MVKNYYETLGIRRDASQDEIANAYKKLALRWHPKLSKDDQKTSLHNFRELSEAYEVLSDEVKRAFYDKYGESRLKDGFFAQGELKGGYHFADNADEIFERFFADNNVLAKLFDNGVESQGSMFGFAFGGQNYSESTQKRDLEVRAKCSLAQLYNGCSMPLSFTRTAVNLDGRTTSQVQASKQVEIRAGSGADSVIEYEGEGHEFPGTRCRSKLVVKIEEQPHPKFSRRENDLIYTANISLADALNSESVEVRTLDNRVLLVSFDEIITPQTVKQIEGEGMPIEQKGFVKAENYGQTQTKGNLYIKFNITFPKTLQQQDKVRLRKVLSS